MCSHSFLVYVFQLLYPALQSRPLIRDRLGIHILLYTYNMFNVTIHGRCEKNVHCFPHLYNIFLLLNPPLKACTADIEEMRLCTVELAETKWEETLQVRRYILY